MLILASQTILPLTWLGWLAGRLYVRNSVTGVEYHHAPVCLVRTRDGEPSVPRNLSAIQQGDILVVSWLPPSDPKVRTRVITRVVTEAVSAPIFLELRTRGAGARKVLEAKLKNMLI